jgi:hypothetical protein
MGVHVVLQPISQMTASAPCCGRTASKRQRGDAGATPHRCCLEISVMSLPFVDPLWIKGSLKAAFLRVVPSACHLPGNRCHGRGSVNDSGHSALSAASSIVEPKPAELE